MLEKFVLVTGCMYSGKSEYLKSLVQPSREEHSRATNVIILLPKNICKENNDKYEELKSVCKIVYYQDSMDDFKQVLLETKDNYCDCIRILVDEVQFFTKDTISELYHLCKQMPHKIELYLAGLNNDFKQEGWEPSNFVFNKSSDIVWMHNAICFGCLNEASYSVKLEEEEEEQQAQYNARTVDSNCDNTHRIVPNRSVYQACCITCIGHPELKTIYKYYTCLKKTYWNTLSLNFQPEDKDLYDALPEQFKSSIELVLGFFAASDTLVNFNLVEKWIDRDDLPSIIRDYLAMQIANENIHSFSYSLLIDFYVDLFSQKKIFNSLSNSKSIAAKANWVKKYINCSNDIVNVFAFVCVEAIFFASSFGFFYYLKAQNNIEIPQSLVHSNDEISKDENVHILFGIEFFKYLQKSTNRTASSVERNDNRVVLMEMLNEAVECEYEYLDEVLRCDLDGLTRDEMKKHVNYMAWYITEKIGDPLLYFERQHEAKILKYIENRMGYANQTNFFEKHKTDYTLY